MTDEPTETFKASQPIRFADNPLAGSIGVHVGGRVLVRIQSDGRVEYDPADLEEGAAVFFDAVSQVGRDLRAENEALRAELATYKATRTLGGPPHPSTPGWYRGRSERPAQTGWDGS